MLDSPVYDVAVIGGGIVGLASAMAIARRYRASLAVLEAEAQLASHQTGHNSGVIHSGLYYRPGSLKATNCVQGRRALLRFCDEHGSPYEIPGKLVVATRISHLAALEDLHQRGKANGLQGLEWLDDPQRIREVEPAVNALAALRVPETGIVDFVRVAQAMAREIQNAGGEIVLGARVLRIEARGGEWALETAAGAIRCRAIVNCAGLHSDRVARLCGIDPQLRIVPFRGEYYKFKPERQRLIRNLVYPVPDPRFPFLGVHFTRMIGGEMEIGPNAVLALKREGYRKRDISLRDTFDTLSYGGFWRMAGRYWRTGAEEIARSFSKRAFVRAMREIAPEIRLSDVVPAGAGVRAQAVLPDGQLLDDFRIIQHPRMAHVLNAPSPAATASIAIGEAIAGIASENFGLREMAPAP